MKITFLFVEHTCQLDSHFHLRALQWEGRLKLDLSGLQGLLELLKERPRIAANNLRPLLEKYLHLITKVLPLSLYAIFEIV